MLVCCFVGKSQNNDLTLKTDKIQTGVDYHNREYVILGNFNHYYSKSFDSKKWDTIVYKFNELPETNDFPYHFFHIKERNYLAHKGCGTIYEFRNDSIVNSNNSYEHKNQFLSVPFVYKDELYYFGGYGLFTFKNILTKFDFKTKRWELVKYNDYSNVPEPRSVSMGFLKDDYLYIVSGYTDNYDTDQTTGSLTKLNDIWKLDLRTKKWEFLGNLKNEKEVLHNLSGLVSFEAEGDFFYGSNKLFALNFENNQLKYTEPKDKYLFSSMAKYNEKTKEILYVLGNENESNRVYKIITEPFDDYKSDFVKTEKLCRDYYWVFYLFCFVVVALFVILFLKRKRTTTTVFDNKIYLKDDVFYYQNRLINNLSIEEKNLLHFFFENINKPLQMNEVVDFFCKDDNTPYNTLTKKKDTVLNSLKQKLAFILGVSEDDLFVLQKNIEDKRIREIQLNPRYFKG